MGCSNSVVRPRVDMQTKQFDSLLEEEKIKDKLHFKLLCLGAGEGGKSTIIKQLNFIHNKNHVLSDEQKEEYMAVLHSNTLQSIAILIRQCDAFEYSLSPHHRVLADMILNFDSRQLMTPEIVEAIHTLWKECEEIQKTFERRSEFYLLDAVEYYMSNLLDFTSPHYSMSEEDVIMTRKRTTGICVTEMEYGDIHWSVVDVGGQRSERKKWLTSFDNTKAILYVVNLAGYCSVLFEDEKVNRMQESLNLFEQTMKTPIFAKVPVFLILNKKDLFETLIESQPLKTCFPDYAGDNSLRSCLDFIAEQYQARLPPAHDKAIVLLMAARVKKDVQYAFEDIKNSLLAANRKDIEKATHELADIREKRRLEQITEMEEEMKKRAKLQQELLLIQTQNLVSMHVERQIQILEQSQQRDENDVLDLNPPRYPMPPHIDMTPPMASRNSSAHALETLSYEDPALFEKLRILDMQRQEELSQFE